MGKYSIALKTLKGVAKKAAIYGEAHIEDFGVTGEAVVKVINNCVKTLESVTTVVDNYILEIQNAAVRLGLSKDVAIKISNAVSWLLL